MRKSEPLSPVAQEEFGKALEDVFSHILQRADEERKQSEPWKQLFASSEKGLQGLLSEANNQMMKIALNTTHAIEEKFGIKCTDKLFNLVKALPFAMNYVRDKIDDEQGMSCCADKARRVYYEEVLDEINKIKAKNG